MASTGGSLRSTSINGVKLYTITGEKSTATWLPPKKLRALRKNKDYQHRLELVQDLRFETATTRIRATPDGEFLIASGIYPPQMKVYELRQLALKFERHLISEIVDFQILSDDYSKIAFMCADRSICLHAKYGSHYSLRIPRMGRDLEYDCWSCDLLCAASSPDLYRINLEQGRFLSPLNTQSPGLNVVSRSKVHGLVACGGDDGSVECFDMRTRHSVSRLDAMASTDDIDQEVTALEFEGEYSMAVGSSGGKVLLYDLRSSVPVRVKDHMYGSPIIDIKWHRSLNSESPKMITTDNHVVRIWDPETGESMSSIEPTGGRINDICVFKNTGLILLALDNSQIPSYFLPALGPAPKWCAYLENLTEEMEESSQTTIYDDYKFLTKEELEKLHMTQLIGTNLLKASMHGFFVDYRLYKQMKAMVNPSDYDEYIENQKKAKLEAERASRISMNQPKLPKVKVNKALAESIHEADGAEHVKNGDVADDTKKSKKKKGLTKEVFDDDRFKAMFADKNFEVDPESSEYKALHPVASKKPTSLINEHFEPLMDVDNKYSSDSDGSGDPHSDDEDVNNRSRPLRLFEVKDQRHLEAFRRDESLAGEEALTMEERAQALKEKASVPQAVKFGAGGSREMSFIAKRNSKYKENDEDDKENGRRGIKSLRMNQDGSDFGSGGRGRGRGRGRSSRGGGRGGGRGGRSRGGGRGGGSRGRGRGRR